MGNINNPPIAQEDELAFYRQLKQHEYGMYHINKIGMFLESIIYHTGDSNSNRLINLNNKPRISNYQVLGQCVKKVAEALPEDDAYRQLLTVTGKVEKIIGQIENELFHSLNLLILEPIQIVRCNEREKVIPYNLELTQISERLADVNKSENSCEESELRARAEFLENELRTVLINSNKMLIQLRNNVYPFLLAHSKLVNNVQLHLEFIIGIFKSNSSANKVIKNMSSINVPAEIEDYRDRIYKDMTNEEKQPILLEFGASLETPVELNDETEIQIISPMLV